MFVRGAPKTIPPPLPQFSVKPHSSSSISHSGSVSLQSVSGSASFSSSVSLSQHSRHSSASATLAAVEEDAAESRNPLPLQVDDAKGEIAVSAIEEEEEEEKQMTEDAPDTHADGAQQQEEKQPELDDDEEDEDDDDEERVDEEEEEEEQEESEGPDAQSAALSIRSDAPARLSASALPASSPVSRAFAIFGREIQHVTPNAALRPSSPRQPAASAPFTRKSPRTVPPPLPALTPMSPPSAVLSPVNPRISVPTLSVPLLRTTTGDAQSPLHTPLTPVTPGSPAAPSPVLTGESAAVASTPFLRGLGESSGSTPTGSLPPPPAARSAATSVIASTPPPPLPKERQSLPVGFQFSQLKLNARAAAACSLTGGNTAMSASSPIHPTSTPPSESPSSSSHASTAPCVLSSSTARNGAATVSEPSSPRRLPSSTVSAVGTPGHEGPMMLRPATADGSSAEAVRRSRGEDAERKDAAAAAAGRAAVSDSASAVSGEGGATQKQKCSKCVSFSVRGSYCLKHLYHAGLAALASPAASSPLPRLSATLHPSSAAYTERMLKVADELYKTEKSYYEALKVAYRSFQLRLEVAAALAENPSELLSGLQSTGGDKGGGAGKAHGGIALLPVLSSAEISTIFSKLHDIFTLSSNLYHDLTTLASCRVHAEPDAAAPSSSSSPSHSSLTLLLPFLGSTLLHYSSYFRVYQPYLENYDDAIRTLVALRSSNVALDVWLTWQEKCEQSALDSLLIMPVQRLPRYLLLLQEIVRCEEQRRAADTPGLFAHYPLAYHDILTARDRIARIADAINLSLHEKEAAQTVSHLQSLFDTTDSKFVPFATPTRKLVKDGLLRKMNETRKSSFLGSSSSAYRFFLFNDLLIAAEESKKLGGVTRYRLKYTIPLLDLRVVDGGDEDKAAGGAGKKELRLRNEVSGKMLRISGKSAEEMAEWRRCIEQGQSVLKELTDSLHVTTFDGVVQDKKERAHKSKAMQMMGIGGAAADAGRGGKATV